MPIHRSSVSSVLLLFGLVGACDKGGESEDKPAPVPEEPKTATYTLVVPWALPVGAEIYRGDDKIGTIVEEDKYHVAKVEVPREVQLEGETTLSFAPPRSPCTGARVPLEHREPKQKEDEPSSPDRLSFFVAKGHWDRAVVHVHRGGKPTKVEVGQADLSNDAEGEPISLFGFDCDGSRTVKLDGEEIGELTESSDTTYWLVTTDPKQQYCHREHQYGMIGIVAPKKKRLKGKRLYSLMNDIDFWMEPAPEKIEAKGSFGSIFTRHSLQTGRCPRK